MNRVPPRRNGAAGRWAAAAACMLAAACAVDTVTPDQPKVVHDMPLTPYDIRQDCVSLAVGDRIDYTFSATEPIRFIIRYHDGNARVAPVVREGTRADNGIFRPLLAREYCLVWEAGPAAALVDYRIELHAAPR
jgi:hypothetical protein